MEYERIRIERGEDPAELSVVLLAESGVAIDRRQAEELYDFQLRLLDAGLWEGDAVGRQYLVSSDPHVYSLGANLSFLLDLVQEGDERAIVSFAALLIAIARNNLEGYGLGVSTASIIRGRAVGGGAEAALANQAVIAEEGSELQMPEWKLGFPPLLGWDLLSSRLGGRDPLPVLEGRSLGLPELIELGIVDSTIAKGERPGLKNSRQLDAMAASSAPLGPPESDRGRAEAWAAALLSLGPVQRRMMMIASRHQS